MNDQTPSMPPLPEPSAYLVAGGRVFVDAAVCSRTSAEQALARRNDGASLKPLYTAEQVQAVADERVRALEAELAGLRAARMAYASEFPPNADGEPDVGSIHANIREMKRKAARYNFLRANKLDGEEYDRPYIHAAERDDRAWAYTGAEADAVIDEAISTLSLGTKGTS